MSRSTMMGWWRQRAVRAGPRGGCAGQKAAGHQLLTPRRPTACQCGRPPCPLHPGYLGNSGTNLAACRYAGDEEGKGGIYNFVTKRGLCAGARSKISWTQVRSTVLRCIGALP